MIKGGDGRILITAGILAALIVFTAVGLVMADVAKPGTPAMIICVLVGFGAACLALFGLIGSLPAKLVFTTNSVTLVYFLGLARRTASLPCPVQIGSRMEGRSGPGGHQSESSGGHYELKVGTYLRLAGPSTITVGCKSNAGTASPSSTSSPRAAS